jgi:ArsR family transcriptional regulator
MQRNNSNQEFKCKYFKVQEDIVEKVQDHLPSEDEFKELINLFQAFADKTKLRIIYILFDSKVCTCELAQLLKKDEDKIITHLKELEELGVVKHKQEEDMTCYYLANNHIQHILVEGCIHKSYIDS